MPKSSVGRFVSSADAGSRRCAIETSVVLQTASSLTAFFRKKVQLAETLLLALLADEAVCAVWRSDPNAATGPLEEAILSGPDGPADAARWHPRAALAYRAAWDRAAARGRPLTRGDLLSGLAGSGGLVAATLRQGAPDLARLDVSDPPMAGEDAVACGPDDVVRIVVTNDDETDQRFVIETLRERFALTHHRARHVMFRTHLMGEAIVCEDAFAAASARVSEAEAAARAAGFPLRFRLITAAGKA
jgi:ATP-dependent Clp protease adapter protein ClpS